MLRAFSAPTAKWSSASSQRTSLHSAYDGLGANAVKDSVNPLMGAGPKREWKQLDPTLFLFPPLTMSPRSWYISPIPPGLRSDPAFSADPHTHLYYATDSNETLHPGGQRRPKNTSKHSPPPSKHSQRPQMDDWPNIPPPYQQYPSAPTPYYADSRLIYEVSPSSSSNSTSSKSSSTPASSTAPSSTDSYSPSTLSTPALTPDLDPQPLPSSTKHSRQSHEMLRPQFHEPRRPAQSRSESSPELHQPPERPAQPPRPATSPIESRPHRAKTRRHLPLTGALDKIDELDETDPFNLGWHHDGPYEAIRQNLTNIMEQKKPKVVRFPDTNVGNFSVSIKPGHIMPPIPVRQPVPSPPDPQLYYQTQIYDPSPLPKIIAERPHTRQERHDPRSQPPTHHESPRSNRNESHNYASPQQPYASQQTSQNHRPSASNTRLVPYSDIVPDNERRDKAAVRAKPHAAPPLQPSNTPRGNFKPPQHHRPKHLVMPAPLQDQQPRTSSSTRQQNRMPPDRRAPTSKAHVAFAQDIPMASAVAGKLVRKGSKLVSPATEEPKAPPRDWLSADGDKPKEKDKEKTRRRLSKRRTDL